MGYGAFQALLDAGLRREARDRQAALLASGFPHMSEDGQRDLWDGLSQAALRIEEVDDGPDDNRAILDGLKMRGKMNAAMDAARKG